tara:strand:+ start:744 stop:1874 length:1131 start_codon:yes stop_codon:yes gene_type:complete
MIRIGISGWSKHSHSFCYVNLEQIRELKKLSSLIYFYEREPLFNNWDKLNSNISKDVYYIDIMENIRRGDKDMEYNISYDIAFPPKITLRNSSCKMIFMVSEYSKLTTNYIDRVGGSDQLVSLYNEADKIITPSIWSRNSLIASGAPENKLRVINHGAAPTQEINYDQKSKTCEELKKKLNIPINSFTILSISSPMFNKGLDVLLNTISQSQYQREFTLIIKGNDPMYGSRNKVIELIDLFNKRNRVQISFRYIGGEIFFHEIENLIFGCNLYASLFRAEGFNLPVLDAYARNIPLLITNAPPVNEYIKNDNRIYFVNCEKRRLNNGLNYFEPDINEAIKQLDKAYIDQKGVNEGNNNLKRSFKTWNQVTTELLNV